MRVPAARALAVVLLVAVAGCVPLAGLKGTLYPRTEPVSDGTAALRTDGYYYTDSLWTRQVLPEGVPYAEDAYVERTQLSVRAVFLWEDGLVAKTSWFVADSLHAEPPVRDGPAWRRDVEAALAALEADVGAPPDGGDPWTFWGTYRIREDALALKLAIFSPEAWPHTGGVFTYEGPIRSATAFRLSGCSVETGCSGEPTVVNPYRFRPSPVRPAREGNPVEPHRDGPVE